MKIRFLFVLMGFGFVFVTPVLANTYESATGAEVDQWSGGASSYSVGQVFTASSDHTITSVDLSFAPDFGSPGTGFMHVVNVSSGLPVTGDLALSEETAFTSGSVNFVVPCVSLSSGSQYAVWFEYSATGGYPVMGIAGSGLVYYSSVWNSYAESTKFTINGDDGSCPVSSSLGTTSTSTQIFYGDWLIVNMWIVFLLALSVMGIFFSNFRRK